MKTILNLILLPVKLLCVGLLVAAPATIRLAERPLIENQFPETAPFRLPSTWRGLVPLCTTRSEAERFLGQPKSSSVAPYIYENRTERVDVLYSAERCGSGTGRWDVPPNTVIAVDVYPHKTLLLEDLVFDREKYIQQKWSHPQGWITYRNEKDGIWVETIKLNRKTEEIRVIRYLPKSTSAHFKCKK